MNFTYSVVEPPDGQWGAIRPDGTWTGMVGLLQEKKVDLCKKYTNCVYRARFLAGPVHILRHISATDLILGITDFTVTKARTTVITFSEAVIEYFHSVFIKRPNEGVHMTAYTDPLHNYRDSELIAIIFPSTKLLIIIFQLSVLCG